MSPEVLAKHLLGQLKHLYDHGGTVDEWRDVAMKFAVLHYINEVKLERLAKVDRHLQLLLRDLHEQDVLLTRTVDCPQAELEQ